MSNIKIFVYGSKTLLPIKGCFYLNLILHDRIDYTKLYIISGRNKQPFWYSLYIYNLNKCEFIKKSICIIQLKF